MEDYLTYLDLNELCIDDSTDSIDELGAAGGTPSIKRLGKRAQMIRENTLIRWTSKHLGKPVNHVTDFCDGQVLHELLTKLFPTEYIAFISGQKKSAAQKMGKLLKNMRQKDQDQEENQTRQRIKTCVRFVHKYCNMRDEKKVINGIELGSHIILDVLSQLSEIYYRTQLQERYKLSRYDMQLLYWLNQYLPDELAATNCDTDWKNGIKLGALLNSFNPDLCADYASWDPDNEVGNLAKALNTAQSNLEGVNQILDATDFHYQGTPNHCIHMYLSQFVTGKIRIGNKYLRIDDVKPRIREKVDKRQDYDNPYDIGRADHNYQKENPNTSRKLPTPPPPERHDRNRPPVPVPSDGHDKTKLPQRYEPWDIPSVKRPEKVTPLTIQRGSSTALPLPPPKSAAIPLPPPKSAAIASPQPNSAAIPLPPPKAAAIPLPPSKSVAIPRVPPQPPPEEIYDDSECYLDVDSWKTDEFYDDDAQEIYEAPEMSVPQVPSKTKLYEHKNQVPDVKVTPAAVFTPCKIKPLATGKFLSELREKQERILKFRKPEEVSHKEVHDKISSEEIPSNLQQNSPVPKPRPRKSKLGLNQCEKDVTDVNSNLKERRSTTTSEDYEHMTGEDDDIYQDDEYLPPYIDDSQGGKISSVLDASDENNEYDYADDCQMRAPTQNLPSLPRPQNPTARPTRPKTSQTMTTQPVVSEPETSLPCQDVSTDNTPSPVAADFVRLISPYDERSREKLMRAYRDNSRLELSKILQVQEGHFSEVYKGRYTDPDKGVQMVAVKIAKEKGKAENLVNEALLMMDFKHDNVMALYGFTVKDGKPYLLLPWMENGDVLTYIRKRSKTITLKRLFTLTIDVLKGMIYLSDGGYIHRDLAARNCLVDRKLRVKISDLTLARDVFHEEYLQESNMGTSYRWTSIEALKYKTYSIASDVWSFGVLWWEIFTCGDVPYKELKDAAQVALFIHEGHRLDRPERADPSLYQLMKQCWEPNPDDRPSFPELHDFVEDKLAEMDPDYITRIDSPYAFSPYKMIH